MEDINIYLDYEEIMEDITNLGHDKNYVSIVKAFLYEMIF